MSRKLTRLSRSSLLAVIQEWLKPENSSISRPYLAGYTAEDDSNYEAAQSYDELREAYSELQNGKGGKKEIVDRIIEGDWRHGISLWQLALADVQYLIDHPASLRWSVLQLALVSTAGPASSGNSSQSTGPVGNLPRFHASTFLKKLQLEICSLAKAHCYLTRLPGLPSTLLRIYAMDSPYDTQLHGSGKAPISSSGASTTLYVAFPDNTASVYVSHATTIGIASIRDGRDLRKLVIDALPKAFSKTRERYCLKTTSLSARSLDALVFMRGPGDGVAASGGWNVFTNGTVEPSPLKAHTLPTEIDYKHKNQENVPARRSIKASQKRANLDAGPRLPTNDAPDAIQKRRRLIAQARFGESSHGDEGSGLERFEVRLENSYSWIEGHNTDSPTQEKLSAAGSTPRRSAFSLLEETLEDSVDHEHRNSSSDWKPNVQLTFLGSNIFAGLRKLVEGGAIDGGKMPGWMTGENSVSIGVVRDGRVNRGSGLY